MSLFLTPSVAKVQEAAYEMQTDTEKKTNHLNFGLILCLSVIDGDEDEVCQSYHLS